MHFADLLNTDMHCAHVPGTAAQPICNHCELWCRHVMRPPSSFRSPRRLERLSGLLHRSSTRRPPLPTRRPPRRPGTLPRRPEMRSAKHCLCCCWPPGLPFVSWDSSSQQSHAIGVHSACHSACNLKQSSTASILPSNDTLLPFESQNCFGTWLSVQCVVQANKRLSQAEKELAKAFDRARGVAESRSKKQEL